MSVVDLLLNLKRQNIFIAIDNGKLMVKGAKGALDESTKSELQRAKGALKSVLMEAGVSSSQYLAPVSFSQQRLLFIHAMQGRSQEYNIPGVFKVSGKFDLARAEQAIKRIIARHDSLRTNFIELQGTSLQVIRADIPFSIERLDLSHLAEEEKGWKIDRSISENADYAFDLKSEPLIRVHFIHILSSPDASEGLLVFNLHHIISDGWSMAKVMAQEFVIQYEALATGQADPLPPLVIQYSDFAHWQRDTLTESVLESQIRYWQRRLEDVPALHTLPLDHPRPPVKTFYGDHVSGRLNQDVRNKLEKIARDHKVTMFMLLHAALTLVIARHSNSQDIVIGTPVAARNNEDIETLIGFFINTLVLRSQTNFDNLPDFLVHIKQVNEEALAHQDIPFERLVEHCNIARSPQHTPLFQIMFYMNVENSEEFTLPDVHFSTYRNHHKTAKFDLNFNAQLDQQGLAFDVEYDTALFRRESVEQLEIHLRNLLIAICENPSAKLRDLSILMPGQSRQLAQAYNQTQHDYPSDQRLHELFIRQAMAQPDAIALQDEQGSMTYQELFMHAYGLAQRLRLEGISCEELVAVQLTKGRHQLIATLAIMMAGGAYLPMEIYWPQARCQSVIETAQARFVITDTNSVKEWAIIALDIDQVEPTADEFDALARHFEYHQSPTNLAYVIFTSGSTGQPKGVAIEHHAAVNTLIDINTRYGVGKDDSVLAVSALSFDLSVYDCFGLLGAGGKVVFPHQSGTQDPAHWLEMVEQFNVTLWNTVPASVGLLTEQLEVQNRTCRAPLKTIMMSGDWIETGLPARLKTRFPLARAYSLGGATEASIWSIHYPIVEDTSTWKSVPYGKPLSNQHFYILDQHMQLAPFGSIGELFIGGVGVAREYFGNPTLTEERFIWHEDLGERIYRTGDLGRYLPDGNIEFLGRQDHQIKIRGFRVELGEIEQQLLTLPSVDSVIVVALENTQKQKHLAAYVKAAGDAVASTNMTLRLKQALKAALPDYMVPTYLVYLENFPLTSNGKVDKKSLPEPTAQTLAQVRIAPTTDVEHKLAAIWADLLKLPAEEISIDANFFELGGSSMQLMRLISDIKKTCGVEISVQEIFEATDLQTLAGQVGGLLPDQGQQAKLDKLTSVSTSQTEELVI